MISIAEPISPFQILPALPRWEYDALKGSIRQHGVIVPVVKDEHGATIDGHHRERVCQELKIKNVPTITLAGLTDEQKRDHALVLNLVRRKITRRQMRSIITAELRRSPDISNQWLAEIVGCTDKTVESVRRELIEASEIPILDAYRGKDGKKYPATRLYTERASQAERGRTALAALSDDAPRKPVTLNRLEREAKKKERLSLERAIYRLPASDDSIRMYHSDFRELEDQAGIVPGTVDLVLTDVPYDRAFVERFNDLGAFAQRVLKEGGVLVVYIGVIQLADSVTALMQHLEYRAVAFSSWHGDGPVIQALQCVTQSTPVLVFSKGAWRRTVRWYNSFHNERAEQDLHEWQKPLPDVEHWLRSFSDPGSLVCDPLAGSGTTAVACQRTGRRFVGGDQDQDAVQLAQQRLRIPSPKNADLPLLFGTTALSDGSLFTPKAAVAVA